MINALLSASAKTYFIAGICPFSAITLHPIHQLPGFLRRSRVNRSWG